MSEKVRSLNFATASGNVLTASNTSAATANICGGAGGSGISLIGAPTLISSTFSATATQSLTPTAGDSSCGGNSPTPLSSLSQQQQHHQQHQHQHSGGSDTESSSEFAAGAIMAQLNFHLLQDINAGAIGGGVGGSAMSESNSIMNSSQISATSNDSIALSSASPATASGAGAAGGGGVGAGVALKANSNGKHVTAQSVAGVSEVLKIEILVMVKLVSTFRRKNLI